MVVSALKQKMDHWILHIRISRGTKFYLKLTFFKFVYLFSETKFPLKAYFRSKKEKSPLCVRPFSHGGQQTQRHFNVSSSSSRSDNNKLKQTGIHVLIKFFHEKIVYIENFFCFYLLLPSELHLFKEKFQAVSDMLN